MRDTTRRGFTFHEHLDSTGLVHMNGRAYDPVIGRFVSADPFVPAPLYSQSLNRYSYVFNNPLAESDPSGYGPDWNFWDIDWPRWLDWDTLFAGNDRDVEVHCNNDSHFCARADYVAAMFMECGSNKECWKAYQVAHPFPGDAAPTPDQSRIQTRRRARPQSWKVRLRARRRIRVG